jgi:hypothetical protein
MIRKRNIVKIKCTGENTKKKKKEEKIMGIRLMRRVRIRMVILLLSLL